MPEAVSEPAARLLAAIRHSARIVLINLSVLLTLLAPIELIFGGWFGGPGDITLLNVRPNTLDVQPSPLYPPAARITYSRDRYGLRGPERQPAGIDVLAVGGSTTNERLLDDSDTWTARLQTLLRQRGCRLSIANSGIDGYSTVAHIASFTTWFNRIPGLKPRFMLLYVGINDAELPPGSLTPADSQKFATPYRRFEHYVAAHSALRGLYVTLRGMWRARQARLEHGAMPIPADPVWEAATLPADLAAEIAAKTAAYRERLETLNRLVREFGARPVYITQSRVDGRLNDGAWQQIAGSDGARRTATLAAFNRVTLDLCHERGETCIDLAAGLAFARDDFYDAVHTTRGGAARIADFLAGALEPLLCRSAG